MMSQADWEQRLGSAREDEEGRAGEHSADQWEI